MRCQSQDLFGLQVFTTSSLPIAEAPGQVGKSVYSGVSVTGCAFGAVSMPGDFPTPEETLSAWPGFYSNVDIGFGSAFETETSMEEMLFSNARFVHIKQSAIAKTVTTSERTQKVFTAIVAAIRTGSLDTALMLFASLEAKQVSEMARGLVNKMQTLQDKRRELSQKIANLPSDKDGSKQLASLQQEMNDLDGDMGIYQQIMKDILQDKNEAFELANSVSQGEHQTRMSIVRR